MVSRFLSVIPAVLAAVSFALSVVLLVAGTGPSAAPEFFWLSFNTSNLGEGIIEITREDRASNGADGSDNAVPGGAFGDFIDGLRDTFEGVVDDMADRIGSGLDDIQSSILGNLTQALGIRDAYSLYLSRICEGDLADPNDPSSEINLDRCIPYDDTREGLMQRAHVKNLVTSSVTNTRLCLGLRNISSSIPSSLTVGRTTLSVPLVDALVSTLDSVLSLGIHGSRALFALLIISAAMTGIVMLASLAVLLLGHRRFLVRINLVASVMGGTALFFFAVVMTGLILGGASILGDLSGAVGLQINEGGPFLALGWVAAVLGMGVAWYWFSVWFVGFRLSSFKRRARTGEEIGNWRGIFREVKSDLRLPKNKA